MGRKKKGKKKRPSKASKRRQKRLRLSGETIEPRILLSATWIEGTDADDDLQGTSGADQIIGYGGGDELRGHHGDDLVVAGAGDNQTIRGGHGDDIIVTGDGDNADVRGDDDDDLIVTGSGADNIRGGAGNDTLIAGSGNDTIRGDRGDDTIHAGAGDDVVRGGSGNDTIHTQGGSDNIRSDRGDDVIHVGGHQDGDVVTIDGRQNTDTIRLAYSASDVTDDGSTLTIDLGNGESFRVDYSNIENIEYDANSAPTVNAGSDTTVNINDPVTLTATASDPDLDTLDYTWTQVGGPAVSLSDSSAATTSFTAPSSDTILVFRVDASDGTHTSTDLVTITVDGSNQAPTVDAGADQVVSEGDVVNLAASASDPEAQPLAYSWTQLSGTIVGLTGGDTASPFFTAPELLGNENLVFQVTASDGTNTTTDTVTVSVQADNDGPSVDAGPDQTAAEGDVVNLAATASDPEGEWLTYMWTQTGGTPVSLTGSTTATPSFTAPELPSDEDLVFEVMVFDGTNTTTDTVTVSVQADDDAPIVDAGPDQTAAEGDVVGLSATASDQENQALTYSWTQISGTGVSLSGENTATPSFTAPELTSDEDLVFEVAASDGTNTTTDTVTVTIRADDDAPTSDAGPDQTVQEGDTVTLGATGSDPEGQPLSYSWTQISGTSVSLSAADTANPSFTAPELLGNEDLVFEVTISDGASSVTDTVTISILADNDGPTVDAGPDQTVAEGDLVNLSATASDPEGEWLTYMWTQVSGTPVNLIGSTTATPSFTAPELSSNQDLVFEVMVFDGTNTITDSVTITVQGDDDAPIVDAGGDQTVSEGDAVNLGATASDPELQPLTYSWTQIGGTAVSLTGANTANPSFTAPELVSDEDLVFEVRASDGANTTTDTVTIAVQADNDGPTVNAGPDLTATEGAVVNLAATASDPEGEWLTYMWTQVSGTPVDLTASTTATPSFTAPELLGNEPLVFEVMVFDGTNTATDTITINVQADNDGPSVDAGLDQSALEGDAVNLAATAIDPEGQGLTYAWTQVSGTSVNLAGGTTATPSFTAPELTSDEDLIFEVAVSDRTTTATDTVTVSILADNDSPTVDAGPDQTVTEGDAVGLGATGSDPEGQGLTYGWTQTSGTPVTLSESTTATPSFTAPELTSDENLSFEVVASDGASTSTDTVTVNVRANDDAPTIDAGLDQTVSEGDLVSLRATASDPEGQGLTYAWTQVSGTPVNLTGGTTSLPTFTAPQLMGNEDLIFELTVSDGTNLTTDTVTISVQATNSGPTLNAGFDQTVTEGDAVTLAATASDPEGQPLTYSWNQLSGTPITLTGDTTSTPSFTVPQLRGNEDLVFEVTADDGTNTSTDTVTIHVQATDDAPSVDGGADRTVNTGDNVSLSSTTADPEGQSLTSSWTQVSGPRVPLSNGPTPGFVAPSLAQDQDLVFQITTTDGANVAADTVTITVLQDSTPLTAFVDNRSIAEVGENVNLTVTASGPGYALIEYRWTQVGGEPAVLTGANTASPSFVVPPGSEGEQLLFQVEVTVGSESVTRSLLVEVESTPSGDPDHGPTVDLSEVPGPVSPELAQLVAMDKTIADLVGGTSPQVLEVMEVSGKGQVTALSATRVGAQLAEPATSTAAEEQATGRPSEDHTRTGAQEATPRSLDTEGRLRTEPLPGRTVETEAPEPMQDRSMWVKVWAGMMAFFRSGSLTGKFPKH